MYEEPEDNEWEIVDASDPDQVGLFGRGEPDEKYPRGFFDLTATARLINGRLSDIKIIEAVFVPEEREPEYYD